MKPDSKICKKSKCKYYQTVDKKPDCLLCMVQYSYVEYGSKQEPYECKVLTGCPYYLEQVLSNGEKSWQDKKEKKKKNSR